MERRRRQAALTAGAVCLAASVLAAGAAPPSGPRFAAGGPEAESYGASKQYPIGDRTNWYQIPFRVGSFSHLDQVLHARPIRRAAPASVLAHVASEPPFRYQYAGESLTIDDYLARIPRPD